MLENYNPSPSTKFIGVTGTRHKSQAEAKASFALYPHGWIPFETLFPMTFTDSEGTSFRACPDFYHPATGYYAEFKAHKMNGRKSKNAADRAMALIDADIVLGKIHASKRHYRSLKNAWNHSIQKASAVAEGLSSHTPFVVIYDDEQDVNEERRCYRNNVFMLSLANMGAFQLSLRLAALGLAVGFERNGFGFSVQASNTH
jgi:hypothetical protein